MADILKHDITHISSLYLLILVPTKQHWLLEGMCCSAIKSLLIRMHLNWRLQFFPSLARPHSGKFFCSWSCCTKFHCTIFVYKVVYETPIFWRKPFNTIPLCHPLSNWMTILWNVVCHFFLTIITRSIAPCRWISCAFVEVIWAAKELKS